MKDLKVLILWHWCDRNGVVGSAEVTDFSGTFHQLRATLEMMREKYAGSDSRPIAQQIIVLP
jgi:hypothetical protein